MAAAVTQRAKPIAAGNAPLKPARRRDALASAPMLKLIEAAEDIFLAKGYHTATMSDVAAQAGMSKKTVYKLIESKGELLAVLLAHHQSLLKFPDEQPGWTIHDFLTAHLLCLARFLLSKEQIAIVRLILAEYTHSPDMGRVFHLKRVQKARSRLELSLAQLKGFKACADCDVREMSAMLFGMALGDFFVSTLIGFRSTPTKTQLETRVKNAVTIFLHSFEAITLP